MATPLEDEPREAGEKFLASHGWSVGKHRAERGYRAGGSCAARWKRALCSAP